MHLIKIIFSQHPAHQMKAGIKGFLMVTLSLSRFCSLKRKLMICHSVHGHFLTSFSSIFVRKSYVLGHFWPIYWTKIGFFRQKVISRTYYNGWKSKYTLFVKKYLILITPALSLRPIVPCSIQNIWILHSPFFRFISLHYFQRP